MCVTQDNGIFEVTLDGRKVKTPSGSVLQLESYPLALAVATEWRNQENNIKQSEMHLTALSFTCQDNPRKESKESLSDKIIGFLETDTLCYRASEHQDLMNLENDKWNPIIECFMKTYNVSIGITDSITVCPVSEETRDQMKKNLLSFKLPSLFGIEFMTENLKSLILTKCLLNHRLSVKEAVSLSRLETEYQSSKWGRIESVDDMDVMQSRSRVSAGLLFVSLYERIFSERKVKDTLN